MASWLVIDADAAIRVANQDAFDVLESQFQLCAPRLLWTECQSVLHRSMRRRDSDTRELVARDRIFDASIELIDAYDRRAPWEIASLLGWHKTYDAEYLAAARQVGAGIFTLDLQLTDGAQRLGIPIVVPG